MEFTDYTLRDIARYAAYQYAVRNPDAPKYLPKDYDEAVKFKPHEWVIEAIKIALTAADNRTALKSLRQEED